MALLFGAIASHHGVDAQQVRHLLGRRPVAWDVTILLSFAALYGVVSTALVAWVFTRVSRETPTPILAATAAMSLMVSAGGVIAFELWIGLWECARLRTNHMSYRALRLPWRQDRLELFVAGVILFLIIAMVRYRQVAHQSQVQSA